MSPSAVGADLHTEILDTFQALTIFVAFVTILFALRYPTIVVAASTDLPDASKPQARLIEQRRRRSIFWSQCVPLFSLTLIPSYLFLPLFIRVLRESRLKMWDFDPVRTGYLFLTLYIALGCAWCGILSARVAARGYR